MNGALLSLPFWLFAVSTAAALLCLAAHIRSRFAPQGNCETALRCFAAPVAFCTAPALVVLTITGMRSSAPQSAEMHGLQFTPLWILVGLPVLSAYCAIGLSLARLGSAGAPPSRAPTSSKVPWISVALIAPAVALLDTISPIEVFFMLLACAAALSIAHPEVHHKKHPQSSLSTPNPTTGRSYLFPLIIFSLGAAGSLLFILPQPSTQLPVLGVLFMGGILSLLVPMAVAAAAHDQRALSIVPLVGDVYLLLLVPGCAALIGFEIAQELTSAAAQLRANIDAGLPPVFFTTHDLEISGFTREAPALFSALPLAGLALWLHPGAPSRSESPLGEMPFRLLGVLLTGFSLVVFAWSLTGVLGR
jgi:hypothetical protein